MTRLKDVAILNRAALPETTEPSRRFRYVDIGSVDSEGRIADVEEVSFEDAPSRARRLVATGDTIISTVRTYLRSIAPIGEDAEGLVISTGFATLTPKVGVVPGYLKWAIRSNEFVDEVVGRSVGVSYPAITATELGTVPVSTPSVEAQRRVAGFLDTEVARIDDLIAEQQSLLTLLAKRLSVAMAEIVTGIGCEGERRPSVHPWWPSLPAHCQERTVRRACGGVTVGVVVNPSTYVDDTGDVPFIRGTDVRPWRIRTEQVQRMNDESNRLLSKSTLKSGDIVVVRVGAPGTAAVVPDELDGANCASVLILRRTTGADSEFLAAVLNSASGQDQIRCMSNGAAQAQVNAGDIVDLLVPFPPVEEQRLLVLMAPGGAALAG